MTEPFIVAILFTAALLAQTTRSVWDGVYTADQSKRGQELLRQRVRLLPRRRSHRWRVGARAGGPGIPLRGGPL